ncbi:hypothetical protein V6N11_080428 [Hibiscus sabdariffa]|uniref:GAG-pre-integrase domain-containing protein n=1 Tax=Hibiscus sabdariffa TaxID=183260 RepID=A0ABR2R7L7_9ROSI
MIVARRNKQDSLYVTQGKLCTGETNVAYGNSCLELWHKRLGHISENGLQILAQKALIPEVITQIIQDLVPLVRYETIEEQNVENQDENNDSPSDGSSTKANEDKHVETTEPEVTPRPELRRSVRERRPQIGILHLSM